MERAQKLSADKIGLHVKARRKHFSWIHSVLDYATANGVRPAESMTTRALTKGRDSAPEHEKRVAWDHSELFTLLRAAIWTGSQGLKKRFAPGWMIFHEGCYFIPLLLPLMGPRNAEAAGLSLAEVYEDAPIPYIHFQDTEFRALKNGFSKRMVPIAPEIVRLGFIDYVKALRADGEVIVFPGLYYPNDQSGFDSPFYKNIFRRWRSACFPDGMDWYKANGGNTEKDAHSLRGSFITLVRCTERIRNMIVGYAGQGQSSTRYDQRTDLPEMLAALAAVSFLTKHIEARPIQLLPRSFRQNA